MCPHVCTQGVDGWDVDLPTYLEANYITGFAAKAAWVLVYILVYGIRPVLLRPKPIGKTKSCASSSISFVQCPAPLLMRIRADEEYRSRNDLCKDGIKALQ